MKIDGLDKLIAAVENIGKSQPHQHNADAVLHHLHFMEKRIMASFEELEQKLALIAAEQQSNSETLVKIKGETKGLQSVLGSLSQAVADLQAQLAAAQAAAEIPQALVDAVTAVAQGQSAVTAAVNEIDALVPDQPTV